MIEIIDLLKPKNGGSFKLIEAIDVSVNGYTSLADCVAHMATTAMIEAINVALSGKQDKLTTEQLAACNSGITAQLVTQIGTNTTAIAGKADAADLTALEAEVDTKADSSDLTTATANLQAQIDELITPVTQDAEVQNARVAADGTSYPTLKGRIDHSENTLSELFSNDKITFTSGYNIATAVSVGEVVDLTPSEVAFYSYAIINVSENEVLNLTAKGGINPRTVCFVDAENKAIYVAPSDTEYNSESIAVPHGSAKCIINSLTTKLGECYHKHGAFIASNNEISKLNTELTETNERIDTVNEKTGEIQKSIFADIEIPFSIGYIATDGVIAGQDTSIISEIVDVNGIGRISSDTGYEFVVAEYDENKQFVSRTEWATTFTPSDSGYIRVCMRNVGGGDHYSDTSISEFLHIIKLKLSDELLTKIEGVTFGATDAITFVNGYNIKTAYNIGDTISLEPEQVSTYSYAIVDLADSAGVVLNAEGGGNPRTYCFLDENNVVLDVAKPYLTVQDLKLYKPVGATKCIINSLTLNLGPCFTINKDYYKVYVDEKAQEVKVYANEKAQEVAENITSSVVASQNSYVYQASNIINALGIDAFKNKTLTVAEPNNYVCWPIISSVGNKVVCLYTIGTSHTDQHSGLYCKTSPNGVIWSAQEKILNTSARENATGKGHDSYGNALFWVRITSGTTHFELWKYDGREFTIISRPEFPDVFAHVADIISTENSLISFYNTYGDAREYGILKSVDDGETWTKTVIGTDLPVALCPVEIQGVYLGQGKILAIGRKDSGTPQFQLQSNDSGQTWSIEPTNISDISQSTSSLIYDSSTDTVYMYYYNRNSGTLRKRAALSSDIWDNPTGWPNSSIVASGGTGQDAGNANATVFQNSRCISYYSGNATDTGIYVVLE